MKRIIIFLLGLCAAACFCGCIFGIDWIWTVKKPAIEKTTFAFGRIDQVLDVADRTLNDVKTNLQAARAPWTMIAARGDGKKNEPDFIQAMVAQSMARQLSPNISEAQLAVEKVTEASIVVSSILDSLHDVEELGRLDTNQVRGLQTQIGHVTKASWELGDLLESRKPSADDETAEQKAARMAYNIDEIIRHAGEFQKNVVALRKRAEYYRTNALYWMNRGPTLATIALGWTAVSQVIVILFLTRTWRHSSRNGKTSV